MVISSRFTLPMLKSDVHAALRAWHVTGGTAQNLLEYLLLVQERRSIVAQDGSPATLRLATNQMLMDCLQELETQDQTAERVLRTRFIDKRKLMFVANKLNVSEHTVSRLQRAAIDRLAEIIYGRELAVREERAQAAESQLPPASYTRLFGLGDARTQLEAHCLREGAPWVVAIAGIGGIGKTALADAVARQIIRHSFFDQVIWIRAEFQNMSGHSRSPRLLYEDLIVTLSRHLWLDSANGQSFDQRLFQVRQTLKKRPYLVVIDNLESETDTAYLLAHLNDLAAPSKFLLTARTRPSKQATVFTFSIDELSLTDAVALLCHHANDVGVSAMATATTADLQNIYNVVGGNPLALKLVVSLLDLLPLGQVLSNLSHSQPGPVEELYRHIYWQSWQLLTSDAKKLLQAMPLVAEFGGLPPYLCQISGLAEGQLWPALQELRNRSLLEVRGTLQEKRYGIHRLTETFLHTEIIRWPEDEAGSELN